VKPRVLIVDDSLTVRMDISEALQAAGFDTVLCADLGSARAALAREGSALVVLDIVLPDGDGLDLLKELKSAPDTTRVPVLLLSTEAEVNDRVRGMGAGADEYIGKPYDIRQVVARARALVQASANRREGPRRRVLMIDDSATFRHELKQSLEGAGYEVQEAATGEEGLALAAAVRPDAVVVDGMLPGIDGATVVRRLKSDTALRSTPCLLLTAAEGAVDELRSLEAGADAYVHKSEDLDVILVRLAALLRGASTLGGETNPSLLGPKRLLAVDDSITYLQELGSQLREEGYDVVLAKSGEEALELLAAQPVDCILLDLIMPGLSGQETCRRIKQLPEWRDIPLVMLTARDDRDAMIEGINAGADDYIAKSADFDVLKARLRAQLRRKHFEDENRRIREQLVRKETDARFHRLIHSNIIGIIVGDLRGHLTDANDAFLTMLGYSRAEIEAGALRSDVLTPAEWYEREELAIEQIQKTGSATPFEMEFFRKDGSRLPIVLGLVLLEGTDRTVGFVLDRTEQKLAEQKINQYAVALEGANRELESFSYSVAHDLRAPLRHVQGYVEMLQEVSAGQLSDKAQRYLKTIAEASSEMGYLIDDLLAFSRMGRIEMRESPVRLDEVVQETIRGLDMVTKDRNIVWQTAPLPAVLGDPSMLKQVLVNLVGNAVKYSRLRNPARIEIGCAGEEDGRVILFVRDNGAGFDMQYVHKLFGVFQRLHPGEEFEGTGIGLATVQRIVARHGGRVWAEGAVSQGATFYFTLTRSASVEPD
jgi:PAS domain S-box-containing protein